MKKVILKCDTETKVVDVPSRAFGFDVNNYANKSELMYMIEVESMTSDNLDETLRTVELPAGNWKIIAKL